MEHFISRLSSPPFPTSRLLCLSLALSLPPCCNSQAFISSHDPAGSGNEKQSRPVFQELSDASAMFTAFQSLIFSRHKLLLTEMTMILHSKIVIWSDIVLFFLTINTQVHTWNYDILFPIRIFQVLCT